MYDVNYSRWLKTENLFFIFTFIFLNVLSAIAGPNRTTYQAKIVKPDGYPLEASAVNFKFTILDPAGACILYSETYSSVNMASTGGLISFALGSGVKTYPVSATTFENVFSNITPNLSCDVGGPPSYSPNADDTRKIVMQFHDGNGWQTLPAMAINAVPYAMYANDAQKLNGKSATDFVEVSTLPMTCGVSEALRFNGAVFSCIAVGDASAAVTSGSVISALGYTPADGANVSAVSSTLSTTNATVAAVSSSVFSVSSTVTSLANTVAASFAAMTSSQWISSGTAISYSAGNVGIGTANPAFPLEVAGDLAVYGAGLDGSSLQKFAMKSNASGGWFETPRSASGTQLNFAIGWRGGGMPAFHIQGVSANVGIGTTTPVTKLDVSGGVRISMENATCAASFAGTLRYNSGVVEYCNGTAWAAFGVSGSGILAINGLVSGSQTFAFGSTGNSPNVNSVGSVHTFNFPFASEGATTAGLISNVDYLNFSNKITSSAASIAQVLGYTPASASALVNYLVRTNNLSDLSSSSSARTNLGLGNAAVLNIGTSAGTVAAGNDSRMVNALQTTTNFSGDVSGAYNTLNLVNSGVSAGTYTSVTVDAKGRVTSGSSSLSASSITGILPLANGGTGSATSAGARTNLGLGSIATYNQGNTVGSVPVLGASGLTSGSICISPDGNTISCNTSISSLSQWVTSSSSIFYNTGNVGVGVNAPTAKLQLASGTTLANTAPLKFTSGSLTTAPEAGAVEYDGFNLYYTDSTANRRAVATTTGTAGSNFNWATKIHINNANAIAGNQALLVMPSNATSGYVATVKVQAHRPTADFTSSVFATFKVGLTRAGEVFHIYSADISNNLITYNWYFDTATGTAYLRFGQSTNSFTYVVDVESTTSAVPSISIDAGTPPAFPTVNPHYQLYSGLGGDLRISTSGTERMRFEATGNVGVGTTAPTAKLHLASGTAAANTAPLKFTSGTLMSAAQAGAVEYNGFDLYFTDGAGVRRALATGTNPNTIDDANNINATGNITMTPTGSVVVSSTTASTNANTGALIVNGGLGVAGNINSSGTIITSSDIQGASITATNAMITPYIYGSTVASGALRLESTTNATKGNILMNVAGGNVGIGTLTPAQGKLQVQQTTDASSGGITVFNAAGSTGARLWVDGNTGAIDVNTGGTGNLIINRGGGHVAIGTTTANGVFSVADATAADIRLENTGAVSSALRILSQNGYNYIQSGASFGANSAADLRFTSMMGVTTWMTLQASTGSLGIGTTAPTAKLNLAAGAATLAPLKLTSGTLLSTAQAGSIEYDGFDFYITDGNNIRRTIATATSAGTLDSVTVVSSPSGIALWPAAGNSVTVSATTASTNSTTGALIVKGGLGVAGNINSSGTIITSSNIQGVSITATNSMVTPYVYGSTVSGGILRLESTTNATKGYILMNATGGNVGIGTATPEATLNVNGALQVGLQSGYYTTLGSNSLGFNRTAASGTYSYLDQRGVGGAFMFRTTQATSLDTNAMTLTASGNLGIGTITPDSLLHMSASTAGDAELLIEADTDDNGEGDNPFIHFKQDGNLTHGYIGLSGNPNEAFNLTVNDVSTNSLVMNSASSPIFLATSNTARLSIATSGNVGISINNASAKLHIASGTAAANTAPIKLTSGTLMSAAQAGSIEYDGFDFYITDGNNIRRTIATATSAGTLDSVTVVSSPSGIALWPAAGNSVTVSATTASTNSSTGALIVRGGLGVAGNINSSGTIITSSNIQGVSITATNSMISPYLYGSTVSGGSLIIESTTHAFKGNTLINSLGGNLGVRTLNPSGHIDIGGGEATGEKRLVFSASDNSDRFYVETDFEASTNSDKLGFRSLTTDNVLVMTGAGKVGVGTASPQLQLTVDDTAGTVSSPYATATDKLAVMSTGNAVIQVTTPNTQSGAIYFSDPESRDPGGVAYSHLTDSMVFRANGATRMTITASGNVGVGTGSPAANLHVFAADTAIAELEVTGSAQGSGVIYVGQSSTFGAGMLYNGDDAPDQLGTSDDVVFFRRDTGVDHEVFKYRYNSNNVTFTGNIGIGTSVPAQRLSVDGDVSITGDLKMTGNDSYIWTNGTGTGYTGIWDTANSRTLLFASESSGNIGIGTTNPTAKLEVSGAITAISGGGALNLRTSSSSDHTYMQFYARSANPTSRTGYIGYPTSGSNNLNIFNETSAGLISFGTSGTNRMVITSAGAVGIGTTNPTYKLDVSGGARVLASNGSNFWSERVDSEYDIQQAAGSTKRGFSIHPATTGGDVVNFYGNNAGSYVLGLTVKNVTGRVGVLNSNPGYPLAVGGDVSIAAGSNLRFDATIVCTSAGCTASSDKRLKENIQPMDFSLEKLLSLNAVQYDWKDKTKFGAQHEIGLIAQDLEKVYPEVVHTDKDSGFKSVSYDKLVAPIIEALKVFNKRIAQLFDRTEKHAREIASVKEENAELKARVEKSEKENADLKKRLERIEKALAN